MLIGHSERREYFGETDELLAAKMAYCLKKGMKVVFAIVTVTLLLQACYITVTLLLHYCYITVTLLLHCCYM